MCIRSSKIQWDLHKSWRIFTEPVRSLQILWDLHRSREIFTDPMRSSQIPWFLHKSHEIFTDPGRYSKILGDLHRSWEIFTDPERSSQIIWNPKAFHLNLCYRKIYRDWLCVQVGSDHPATTWGLTRAALHPQDCLHWDCCIQHWRADTHQHLQVWLWQWIYRLER